MTIKNEIAEYLESVLDFESTPKEIADAIGRNPSSVRSALSRGKSQGFFSNKQRGVYILQSIYYKVRITKTSFYGNENKGNVSIDAYLEGWIRYDQLNINSRTINSDVKRKLNEELVEQIIEYIEDDFNQVDGSVLIKIKKRGFEILDNEHNFTAIRYNMGWDYKIDVTTSSGTYTDKGERRIDESRLY